MINRTKRHIWPVAVVAVLAVAGLMASLIVLSSPPGTAQAQEGLCDTASGATLAGLIAAGVCPADDGEDPVNGNGDSTNGNGDGNGSMADMIMSDSDSPSGAPQIELTIAELGMDLNVGSSIVLYLEDDFQEPDSIPMSSVYLVAEGGDRDQMVKTGNGSRVYVTSPVKIKTGAYFDEDKKDIAIRVLVPDMCTTDTPACQTSDGPKMGQKVTLVIESDSGINNPSEAGTHSVFFDLLGAADRIPSASNVRNRNDAMRDADPPTERTLPTVAKISLSDVDNKRGYELTIIGSGFNDGTTASAYVLKAESAPMDEAGDADCEALVNDAASTLVGSGLVGSDDKVTITAEVTVPTFGAGNVNQICMVDGENRYSSDTGFHDAKQLGTFTK